MQVDRSSPPSSYASANSDFMPQSPATGRAGKQEAGIGQAAPQTPETTPTSRFCPAGDNRVSKRPRELLSERAQNEFAEVRRAKSRTDESPKARWPEARRFGTLSDEPLERKGLRKLADIMTELQPKATETEPSRLDNPASRPINIDKPAPNSVPAPMKIDRKPTEAEPMKIDNKSIEAEPMEIGSKVKDVVPMSIDKPGPSASRNTGNPTTMPMEIDKPKQS